MARRYPNIYLEMSGMPMHTKIKEAYDTVGHDRIMFGTDTPFHHPTVEMQKVLMSGVDEQGLEDIFYNNAKKYFSDKPKFHSKIQDRTGEREQEFQACNV